LILLFSWALPFVEQASKVLGNETHGQDDLVLLLEASSLTENQPFLRTSLALPQRALFNRVFFQELGLRTVLL